MLTKIKKKAKTADVVFLSIMLAVPIINWLVFWLYVNFSSILLAFQTPFGEFTLQNFADFAKSIVRPGNEINISLKNTFFYFSLGLAIGMPLSFIISYFVFKRILGYKVFRIIFYLPCIIAPVIMVSVFKQFIKPWGPLGVIVNSIAKGSFPESGLLGQPETATPTIIFYTLWAGLGGNMLLFSGAMTRIPNELLESAKIEGCSPFRELVSIVLPLVWPTVSTVIVIAMTGLFTASGPILLLVNGSNETTTIAYWIFYKINGDGYGGGANQYNIVSAAGLCFTAIVVPLVLIVRKVLAKFETVEY